MVNIAVVQSRVKFRGFVYQHYPSSLVKAYFKVSYWQSCLLASNQYTRTLFQKRCFGFKMLIIQVFSCK